MSGNAVSTRRGKRTPAVPEAAPALSPREIESESVEGLTARGAAYARHYATIEGEATTTLKNIAVVLVVLRSRCTDTEGRIDWHGRSQEYRDHAGDVYRRAGITPETAERIQRAVRYHIGNHLRDVVPPEVLTEYNLKPSKPLDRNRAARETRSALVATARAELEMAPPTSGKHKAGNPESTTPAESRAGAEVKATADHLRLTKGARTILSQLDPSVIDDHMTDGQRAKLDDELAAIQEIVSKLRRKARKRRSAA
jgi:hypothetical protein